MATSEPINANPTVLDISQLPTRRNTAFKGPDSLGFENDDPAYSLSLFRPELLKIPDERFSDTYSYSENDDSKSITSEFSEPREPIDSQEIYDLISTISDPEHPLTLGQLAVVNLPHITVSDSGNPYEMAEVKVEITPTITHCSLATLIGLGIRVRLERCLPPRYRITINVREGTHQSEGQVNKQLNDKERIAAACENDQLLSVISNMLSTCR
ncbi:Cia2p [Sugiyamaella lignohabitans]|uniref:Cia2p n=1 Tax=Sugiyamaella lignohabitans TaxID=796027 RepID=A0A167EJY0_9ASCO|nr:Cia2p [Sugiyamaella lignohabitans]ANB14164.1 Cia2p [Sugiyamaella lignohabitans]